MVLLSPALARRASRASSNSIRWHANPPSASNQKGSAGRTLTPTSTATTTTSSSSHQQAAPASTTNQSIIAELILPKAFAIGTVAGVCGSLAGMGGGFVMIPLMTSNLLRLTQHQAHGTSLFAVTTTGMAGALGYAGQVNFEAAAAIACCGMVTARLGARMTSRLSEHLLKRALGIFMICVAPLVPLKSYLVGEDEKDHDDDKTAAAAPDGALEQPDESIMTTARRVMIPATIGLGSGFMAGLFGVGGGAIVVPALTVTTDMTHVQALGTSLCAMVLPAMVGTYTHHGKGNVAMRVAPPLAMGAFVGGYLGGQLGLQSNETALRWGFSALMITLGVRTFRAA
jgi:uncharacterized protein